MVYRNWQAERGKGVRRGRCDCAARLRSEGTRMQSMTSSTTPPACWVSSLSSRLPPRQAPHRAPGDLSHCRGDKTGSDPAAVEGRVFGPLRHGRGRQWSVPPKQSTASSNKADAPPTDVATTTTTASECSSSTQGSMAPPT